MEKIYLFPTTVWKVKIDPNSYDKDVFVRTVAENYRRDPYRNMWSNEGTLHHSYNDWDNEKFVKYDLSSLHAVYSKIIDDFANAVGLVRPTKYSFEIANVTANKGGQYMAEHDHVVDWGDKSTSFVAVHYVKYEKHQPSTTFLNPMAIARHPTFFDYVRRNFPDNNSEYSNFQETWEMCTEEDDFVIFPSYLKHKVRGNWRDKKPNELRITTAVNIDFEKSWLNEQS